MCIIMFSGKSPSKLPRDTQIDMVYIVPAFWGAFSRILVIEVVGGGGGFITDKGTQFT